MLESQNDVIRSLITYTDWWQPFTGSVLQVGGKRGNSDGLREGLVDTFDERTELRRRVWLLDERDRHVLFLWYVRQLPTRDIAQILGMSRRTCMRRKADAVRKIVDLGTPNAAA